MNTRKNKAKRFIKTGVMLASLLAVGACSAHSTQYKPHHNQQHSPHHRPSVQVMFDYDYFPEQHVYYDRHNRLYHYHHIDLGWLTVSVLPEFIHLNHHRRHKLSYNHNRPWQERHANKHHYSHHQPRHVSRHEQRSNNKHYDKQREQREQRRDYRQNHRSERRDHHEDKYRGHGYEQRSRH